MEHLHAAEVRETYSGLTSKLVPEHVGSEHKAAAVKGLKQFVQAAKDMRCKPDGHKSSASALLMNHKPSTTGFVTSYIADDSHPVVQTI